MAQMAQFMPELDHLDVDEAEYKLVLDDEVVRLSLPRGTWEIMGKPSSVKVTIEVAP